MPTDKHIKLFYFLLQNFLSCLAEMIIDSQTKSRRKDRRGKCKHLGLLLSILGSDELMVDDYIQGKSWPKRLVDPSPVSRTHIKMPNVMAHSCNPSARDAEIGGPLGLINHSLAQVMNSSPMESIYLKWRWTAFLRMTLQVVLWSPHIHRHMHMCVSTPQHTLVHTCIKITMSHILNLQFVTAVWPTASK